MAFPNRFTRNFPPLQTWYTGRVPTASNTYPDGFGPFAGNVLLKLHQVHVDTPAQVQVCCLADKHGTYLQSGRYYSEGYFPANLVLFALLALGLPSL